MSTQTNFPKQAILGVELDSLGITEAIDFIMDSIGQKEAHYIVKPYVVHLDRASSDPKFRQLLNSAYLALPDGVSLNWAVYFQEKTKGRLIDVFSSLLRVVIKPEELNLNFPNCSWGTNFTWALLEACARNKLRVYIVGSPKHSSIEMTKEFLEKRIKGLEIVGSQPGRDPQTNRFSEKLETNLINDLVTSQPDITLIGIGLPEQEQLAARLAASTNRGVFIGEGGTFDFDSFGGVIKKAPSFFQQHGLEWLWRLFRQPWRIKRQLAIPRFIWKVYKNKRQLIANSR